MSVDKYENQLLYLIDYYGKEVKFAEREIKKLIKRNKTSFWKDTDLTTIEGWRENIKELNIKINTTWVCLDHYRSLLGV